MRIIDLTRQTTLATSVEVADTFNKRLRGLIGRRTLGPGEALLLTPCQCVHTWFMLFPIDLVYLDAKWQVLATVEALRPFRFGPLILKTCCILELPGFLLRTTGTVPGNNLGSAE